MIHIQRFIERLQGFEARGARDFTMPIKDAKDLHADLTRLLITLQAARESVRKGGARYKALGGMRDALTDAYMAAGNIPASAVQKAAAGLAVPGGAALAGLGGVAAGMVPGALGVPGFQQQSVVDPESYGSSNSYGAVYKQTTPQYY